MINTATYGWVFHQDLEGKWCAAKREHYFELFNGDKGNVLRSGKILDLVELINKTGGNKAEIQKLIDGKKDIDTSGSTGVFNTSFKSPEAY
jgi:hypothetical protein